MKLPSFRELSKEQDKIYNLPLDVNFLISGPPGTGKTVMALYRASMYKKQNKSPILLSYSKLLASYTGSAASELDIASQVLTYHKWVYRTYYQHFGRKAPQLAAYIYDWPQIIPQLYQALGKNRPYLMIDEGQDLPPDFYLAATLLSENLSVFADENQRITETQSTFEEIKRYGSIDNEYHLTKNYRNTLEIANAASSFYAGLPTGKPESPTRRGPLPTIQNTENFQSAIDYIARFERNNSHLEIGVFTKSLETQKKLRASLSDKTKYPVESYQHDLKELPTFGKPGIKLINYNSAKGLEFDVVFIPELQSIRMDIANVETRMLFYVLLSRARDQLFLLYSGNGIPEILNFIPRQFVEIRKR